MKKKIKDFFWCLVLVASIILLAGEKEPEYSNTEFLLIKVAGFVVMLVSIYFLKGFKFQNNNL